MIGRDKITSMYGLQSLGGWNASIDQDIIPDIFKALIMTLGKSESYTTGDAIGTQFVVQSSDPKSGAKPLFYRTFLKVRKPSDELPKFLYDPITTVEEIGVGSRIMWSRIRTSYPRREFIKKETIFKNKKYSKLYEF